MNFDFENKDVQNRASSSLPLTVEEVVQCLINRWGVSYDLNLLVRGNKVYLQIMWAYLEQQSFPMSDEEYRNHLSKILEIVNRVGQSQLVRNWLKTIDAKPRIGRAVSLPLMMDYRLKEFLYEN